jgi:putative NADH-flavin reductase
MKLIIFGSTGGSGIQIVRQALYAGHTVTAIARNPAAVTIQHPNLSVIKADVLQLPTFEDIMRQQDAVLSALGFRKLKDEMVYSQGIYNITAAMHKYGLKRIICVSASAVETSPKLSFIVRMLTKLLQLILKKPYADVLRMEQQLKETNLDWTVVRPPRLTNGKLKARYRFAVNDWLPHCTSISRADLAHFMLQHINDGNTYRSIIEVAY